MLTQFAIPIFIMIVVSAVCGAGASVLTPGPKRQLGIAFAGIVAMSTLWMILAVAPL